MTVDKGALFAARLPQADVEIPGLGTVRVRGLSREEMLNSDAGELPTLLAERRLLAKGMVDPAMTEDEIALWQAASPAMEINIVSAKINELSGISAGVAKEAYKSL